MLSKTLFLLAVLLLLASPVMSSPIPEGTYMLNGVIDDPDGEWSVVVHFTVDEAGAVHAGRTDYPGEPCKGSFDQATTTGSTIAFKETVTAGNDVCSPAAYEITINDRFNGKNNLVTAMSCTLDGQGYKGAITSQKIDLSYKAVFYQNLGIKGWDDLAQSGDLIALDTFQTQFPGSIHASKLPYFISNAIATYLENGKDAELALFAKRHKNHPKRSEIEDYLYTVTIKKDTPEGYKDFLEYAQALKHKEEATRKLFEKTPPTFDNYIELARTFPTNEQVPTVLQKAYAMSKSSPAQLEKLTLLFPNTQAGKDALEDLYDEAKGKPESLATFAQAYPDTDLGKEAWQKLLDDYTGESFLTKFNLASARKFINLNPPEAYRKEWSKRVVEGIRDSDENIQIAFIKDQGVTDQLAAELLGVIAQKYMDSEDIGAMSWIVAEFPKAKISRKVASKLAETIYEEVVIPQDNVGAYNQFCTMFSESASEKLLKDSYNRAFAHLKETVDDSVDSATGVFTSQQSEDSALEKLVRNMYSDLIGAKKRGEYLLAQQLMRIIKETPRLKETRANFDLLRDDQMRAFLGREFEKLIHNQSKNAAMLASKLDDVRSSVTDVSTQVKNSKPTREELRQQNWDRFFDGKAFKASFGDY